MADIFGKNPQDYAHFRAAEKDWGVDLNALSKTKTFQQYNKQEKIPHKKFYGDALSAAGFEYETSNLNAMQAQIEHVLYTDARFYEWCPPKTDVPEWAASYSYPRVNIVGKAQFVTHSGTDAKTAQISVTNVPYSIAYGMITPTWTRRDLQQAQATGVPLDNETITAGTTLCLQHIERVALGTDSQQVFESGLLNNADITILVSTISWATATAQEITDQINSWFAYVAQNTNEIYGRNLKPRAALYLPPILSGYLNRVVSSAGNRSIWEYVRENNIWTTDYTGVPLEKVIVTELATAGAGGTSRAIIGYPDSIETWELAMPISPRVVNIDRVGVNFQAPIEYAVSGLNVKRAGGLLYVDGA